MSRLTWTDPHVHVLVTPAMLGMLLGIAARLDASWYSVSLHQKLET